MLFEPSPISHLIANSLQNSQEGLKSGRLDGSKRSINEAQTGNTKKGTRGSGRILIGLDDNNDLIILDGRHLLEAYRIIKKQIPSDVIAFESNEAYALFIKAIQ